MGSRARSATRLVTVGNELLAGDITDINSPYLAQKAFSAGFPLSIIEVVPDNVEAIAQAIKRAVADPGASRIVVAGGVGPTHDDVTLEGVAAGLGLPLELHPQVYDRIATSIARLHEAGRLPTADVSPAHRRMAVAAAGARVLDNPRGLASPFAHSVGEDRWLFVLPGVPHEFRTVVDDVLMPNFFGGGTSLYSAEIQFEGLAESRLAPALETVENEFADVSIGSYPHAETRNLTIRARGTDPQRLAAALARIKELAPR